VDQLFKRIKTHPQMAQMTQIRAIQLFKLCHLWISFSNAQKPSTDGADDTDKGNSMMPSVNGFFDGQEWLVGR
jgi:hypothetical protein